MACFGLLLDQPGGNEPRPLIFKTFPMTHLYVQTFYGAENGWRSVGSRRTPKDAARFCSLLNRVRNDRINKVVEVPVRFVLGEE